jgi:enolase-phosphatase E1
MVRAIIMDIEGTTTPIRFVREVLFPYSAAAMRPFLERHGGDAAVRELLADVVREAGLDTGSSLDACVRTLEQWIAADRKITALKALQGHIWRDGYERGAFTAPVYPDVPRQLARWHAAGIRLYVYSSGSVDAQRLLFGHTDQGDLTPLFDGWFDTRTGPKNDPDAYRAICATIDVPPGDCLFLSDAPAELDAARAVGLRTLQLLRPGDDATPAQHPNATSFDDIDPLAD